MSQQVAGDAPIVGAQYEALQCYSSVFRYYSADFEPGLFSNFARDALACPVVAAPRDVRHQPTCMALHVDPSPTVSCHGFTILLSFMLW